MGIGNGRLIRLFGRIMTVFCLAACHAFFSCSDDLAIGRADQPVLSADTLHIGTVLAGNSTKTYLLKLYNWRDRELRLTSIALRSDGSSGFRMNVDGMNGTSFTNADLLRIASGDSLFMFVEATFPPSGDGIVSHTDYIDIICNSRTQTIVLQAESKDVLRLEGAVIEGNTEWSRGMEVQVFDSLVIAPDACLTLHDSVTLYLHDKADIIVHGTLLCQGQPGSPVVIRGDRTDNMFPNLAYDDLPSQWGSLYISSQAHDCSFVHTDIRGMTDGIHIDSTNVTFSSCNIRNSDGSLITCHMTELRIENSLLTGAAGSLLDVYGGWHDIIHCTLANYNFASRIQHEAVHLCNIDTAAARYTPLHKCVFTNTIIWGEKFDPDVRPEYYRIVSGEDSDGNYIFADSIFSYRFDHCLLRANGTDDADFIQTLWNQDPLYELIDAPNYTYDFHLQPESPARSAGASLDSLGISLPFGLDGRERNSVTPDLGCY